MSGPVFSPASGPPSGGQAKLWGLDDRYVVTLTVGGEGGYSDTFQTPLDETFALSMGSQWAAPFENVLQEAINAGATAVGIGGKTQGFASLAATAFGIRAKNKYTSAQIWQSSDPMEITVPFTFIANTDPATEVRDKVKKLLMTCAPSEAGGLLAAPGPTLAGAITGGRDIKLQIGKFITLTPCVIKDVQVQFDSVIGELGIPLRAKVNVQICSWYSCFTVQDIEGMFSSGRQGGGGLSGGGLSGGQDSGLAASMANGGYYDP